MILRIERISPREINPRIAQSLSGCVVSKLFPQPALCKWRYFSVKLLDNANRLVDWSDNARGDGRRFGDPARLIWPLGPYLSLRSIAEVEMSVLSLSVVEADIADYRLWGILHQIAGIARTGARGATAEWVTSISILPTSYGGGKVPQTVECVICPDRSAVPNELVRLDLNIPDFIPSHSELKRILCLEIEPFIIGAGNVRVKETAKGIVVLRLDAGLKDIGHDFRSLDRVTTPG
jgi:hypothetical protein